MKILIGIVYGFTKLNVVDFSGIVTEMFQHASINVIFRYHIELLEDSSKLIVLNTWSIVIFEQFVRSKS